MKPCEVLDDREAEARPADLARTRPVGAVKSFKYARGVFGQNTFARVRDRYYVAPGFGGVVDADRAAGAVEFDRVVDKIRQHLFETHGVGKNGCARRNLILQSDLAFLRFRG